MRTAQILARIRFLEGACHRAASVLRSRRPASSLAGAIALAGLLAVPAAHASTIVGACPAPNPGLNCDDGAQIFVANANPNHGGAHIVLAQEVQDPVPASIPHEFGFYFTSDPGTLYPIFTAADQAPPTQQELVDFDHGQLDDVDAGTIDGTFPASLGSFGIYLKVDLPSGSLLTFSQPSLNPGGVDTFASFPYTANPLFREVGFQVGDQVYSIDILDGAVPVPEPATLALLAGGIALLASRRRA